MRTQCCACRRIKTGDGWQATESPPDPHATHTYCPACYDALRLRAQNEAAANAHPRDLHRFRLVESY